MILIIFIGLVLVLIFAPIIIVFSTLGLKDNERWLSVEKLDEARKVYREAFAKKFKELEEERTKK